MRLSVATHDGDVMLIDVESDELVENVMALLEVQATVPIQRQILTFNGTRLNPSQTLSACGVREDDLLMLTVATSTAPSPMHTTQTPAPASQPVARENLLHAFDWFTAGSAQAQEQRRWEQEAQATKEYFALHEDEFQQLLYSNPPLANAILDNNTGPLIDILKQLAREKKRREDEEFRHANELNADPLDPVAQAKIAEEIRGAGVQENLDQALEYMPESFGQVHMLYINCTVNGTPVKAFVDSGAQSTIMSLECAGRCNLERLIDHRFAGRAVGVGTGEIVGKVHVAPLKIGSSFFPSSFTVLKESGVAMLLGLDMLKETPGNY